MHILCKGHVLKLPPLLSSLRLPDDVPGLTTAAQAALAQEVRDVIIDVVSRNGGHLAPSLGVVELTIALLSVFQPAHDAIVWDVGHQAYPWKLLTGRADSFDTLRRFGGLSGFPRRGESPYDRFGVGHASTSISAALGMASARDLQDGKEHVVAVIGDGALTGGMAFEALNQAGGMGKRLIVVLNDNEMSISNNVGALSRFLSRNLAHAGVMRLKYSVAKALLRLPQGRRILRMLQRGEQSFKSFFTPGMLFEAFRFTYIGPVDGHDIPQLMRHLEAAKQLNTPVLLHVRTIKGKGYSPAERNPSHFHGVSSFCPDTGLPASSAPTPSDDPVGPGFTTVFSQTLCELATHDPRIVAITAAMPDGTGTSLFQRQFPDRFVDVGICEEHAVTFAAGLAAHGMRPVVAIYSTFLQRAYDQIIHDVCLQKLPVVFCLDRAGLVGEDGPTHHGAFDLSWLRVVPNLTIFSPYDEEDLRHVLYTAMTLNAPVAIRYPRGRSQLSECAQNQGRALLHLIPPGTGQLVLKGDSPVCVLAEGLCAHHCVTAARLAQKRTGKLASVYSPRWIKPLPEAEILSLAQTHDAFLIAENNSRIGGFSSAVLELLADNDLLGKLRVRRMGLPDAFVPHGSVRELRRALGVDRESVAAEIAVLLTAGSAPETLHHTKP